MPHPLLFLDTPPPSPSRFLQLVGLGRAEDPAEDTGNGGGGGNNKPGTASGQGKSGKESGDGKEKETDVAVDEDGWEIPAAAGKV